MYECVHYYLEEIVRLEVRLQRIDEQQHQLVAGVQTQRDGEVADALDVNGLKMRGSGE